MTAANHGPVQTRECPVCRTCHGLPLCPQQEPEYGEWDHNSEPYYPDERRSEETSASLDKRYTALVFKAARLVDARDAGDPTAAAKLEAVRAERTAVKAELRRRHPNFDRWEC